jgi:arsenical pump membrane protein
MTSAAATTWAITALSTGGVILRPFRVPAAAWAVAGAAGLVALRVLSPAAAWRGVLRGADVYLFLTGMMLLAEVARQHGVFDWLATHAARHARQSAPRLFTLIYGVGTVVTVLLSNDATAVVLTPAVAAAARRAGAADALPYLFIPAFIANAASFVLPISNPANLVIFGGAMPTLAQWLLRFMPASVAAILATYGALRLTQRAALRAPLAAYAGDFHDGSALGAGGRIAAGGIGLAVLLLVASSAAGLPLGVPAAVAGIITAAAVVIATRTSPLTLLRDVSWSILPLVAGLFVLVEALDQLGLPGQIASAAASLNRDGPASASVATGVVVAGVSNLVNNLPAGLLAGAALRQGHLPPSLAGGVLIGVDLGPNLSVTGSLATLLWLEALRREGVRVSAWSFLRLGLVVMPPALVLSLMVLCGAPAVADDLGW